MRSHDEELLLELCRRYPGMRPQDAVKLLYQCEFGGGHLISDPAASLKRLRTEYRETVYDSSRPLWEEIGGGKALLHLAPLDAAQLPLERVNQVFILSAELASGGWDSFEDRLETLQRLTREGRTPFPPEALADYLAEYHAAGCPAVSHSDAFREAYHPAYRVIDMRFARLLPALPRIEGLLRGQDTVRIALDGHAASGKTTASRMLALLYGGATVHMDDFFLPFPMRTPERLAEPGGNVHYERFCEEALPGLASGEPFSYRVFDCSEGDYRGHTEVPAAPVRLVEGSYSMHPRFGQPYDLRLFFQVDPAEQLRRILERGGPERLRDFQERWIPMEHRYFDAFQIPASCDWIL